MQLESLIGLRLTRIEVCEAWGKALPKRDAPSWGLSAALAMDFGEGGDAVSLICTSPLRYLSHQQGTMFGLASGTSVSLGYRVTVCESADALTLKYLTTSTQADVPHWSPWRKIVQPAIGQILINVGVTANQRMAQGQGWGIELTFASGQNLRLSYRADLDGNIELAAPGENFRLEQITVQHPDQDFGWLHPAAPLNFILDDQVWPSAQVAHWPHALRKALQSHHEPDAVYRQTMLRALLARFRQRPWHLQRLLALRYPVQIKDVPGGLIQEVATALRKDSLAGPVR